MNINELSCCNCSTVAMETGTLEYYRSSGTIYNQLLICKKCGTIQRYIPATTEQVMSGDVIHDWTKEMDKRFFGR